MTSPLPAVLPQEACEWNQITHLSLQKNQLTTLPPQLFVSWTKVGVSLASLSPQCCWLQAQKIILSFNRLTELPESIRSCALLSELDLCGNCLEGVPETLRFCRHLKRLNIGLSLSLSLA
jgi:Leucine-rich repeat (LRR) protein